LIFNPEKHQRRSVRFKEYDYSQPGAYFVTICSWLRGFIFGEIINSKMELNEYGIAVEREWFNNVNVRTNIELDQFIIMPNHVHCILIINRKGVLQYAPTKDAFRSPTQTLGAIIRGYKSTTTKQINSIRNTPGMPVWQRNYFEHIISNEIELNKIREYISNNPLRWAFDKDNPLNIQIDP
jgi:putative transposase